MISEIFYKRLGKKYYLMNIMKIRLLFVKFEDFKDFYHSPKIKTL